MNEYFEREQTLITEIKQYISENFPLSKMEDEELEGKVEEAVNQKTAGAYLSIEQRLSIVKQIYSSIRGFGLLDTIISDDTIIEVMINGHENVFIEKSGKVIKLDKQFESQRRLEDIIQRVLGLAGREVNQANPIIDTRLPDGFRVNVVLPLIAMCGPAMTIRKFSKTPMTIERLIQYGSLTRDFADKLELLVKAKYNIFICGGTGSGKTTFLNALSNYIPRDERVITIEDSAELQIGKWEEKMFLKIQEAVTCLNDDYLQSFCISEETCTQNLRENCRFLEQVCEEEHTVFVHGKGKRKTRNQKYLELFRRFLERQTVYDWHTVSFRERNNYCKTDPDATLDSGYESEEGCTYLRERKQKPYIKPQTYEKWKKRSFKRDISKRENMGYNLNKLHAKIQDERTGSHLFPVKETA